jgi:hypothetical protein
MSGIDGSSSWRTMSTGFADGTWDETGNHPSCTEKSTMSNTPLTNSGSAISDNPDTEITRSSVLP